MNPVKLFSIVHSKGFRLVYTNIKERMLFDFINRTDTIGQIPKAEFSQDLPNLAHGLHYSSSWTSEIKFGFHTARNYLGREFNDYAFIDVGCGKGKTQIVWELLLRRAGVVQPVYGLDYYDQLIPIAARNHVKALKTPGNFIISDASQFKYIEIGRKLLIYMYNPFDGVILEKVTQALKQCDVVLIYNNPEYRSVLLNANFSVIKEKKGFHPQAWTVVYWRARDGGDT